ncbi:MAG: hypothetical protein DMG89_09330 [Acidobacteria bacterium]|nr:MAG: hypothetical protein DMG89_09330 [Acidobacteriota bacterium]
MRSTPSTLGVSTGEHQVSLKKSGFRLWDRRVTISSGHIKIDAALEREAK